MFELFYKRPHLLFSLILLFFIMGVIGLVKMPKNLFPDAERPTVIVITKIPGATASVSANTVSKPVEKEISRLSLVRDVSSVNVPNLSIVKVEFEYKKGLEAAAVDVSNALSIAKSKLPPGANPAIYTTGAFTLPVDVVALSPKNDSITLSDIRQIADSFLKPRLLSNPAIGNVEVFGGRQGAINLTINPLKAKKYHIDMDRLIQVIASVNRNIPIGFVKGGSGFFTLTYYGEKDNMERLKHLHVMPNVMLQDIADVSWGYQRRFSGYFGNGKEAVALAVERAPGGSVLDVSNATRAEIKKLAQQYPKISFQISDTQRDLVETSNANMLQSLRDAIIFTLIVLLFFLGNFKALIAAAISIPMVFFSTLAILWLFGGELNIVVYTAIILSLGMLVDDAVVILENIERHMQELKEDIETAIIKGTREVIAPVFAGTVGTVAIVSPMLFVGGYQQHIFRPLIGTMIIAMLVSYVLSIGFIPRLSLYLYRKGTGKTNIEKRLEWIYQHSVAKGLGPFLSVLHFSNGKYPTFRKIVITMGALAVLIMSVKNIMPMIGKDLMPPMDTGIVKAEVYFSTNDTVEQAEHHLKPFIQWLNTQKYIKMSSISFGSEAGVLSLGSGALPSEAVITINCVDRFHRKQTIWQLEDEIRDRLHRLAGLKNADVYDFGATPVSSIKAPLDIRLKSPSYDGLPMEAHKIEKAIKNIRGLKSTNISWDKDLSEAVLKIDVNKALSYGLSPAQIAMQIPIKDQIASLSGDFESMNTQFVRMYFKGIFSKNLQAVRLLPIHTKFGDIPLGQIASINYKMTQARIERDKLLYSIDINGYRAKRPITQIVDDSDKILSHMDTTGYELTHEGNIAQLHESFKRTIKALAMGLVAMLLTLIVIYKSVRMSLIMILILPLSLVGGSWMMLLTDKPQCLPSMVGVILLFGIIIKNAVLFVDFYQDMRKHKNPFDSALESLKLRYRPILMTSFGTMAGMLPIAFERAIGMERLSPLADVSIGGLLSFITLIFIPMFVYWSDSKKEKIT